jgi:hypothetical protein
MKKRVFISYVHEDVEFARYLAAALRAAGLEPWLDEENLEIGDELEARLKATIEGCDCGVFLVAPRFAKSNHCMNELRIFAEHFPDLKRFPILRAARKTLDIPAHLGGRLLTLEWIDNQTVPDEALYLLLCSINGATPGPKAEWARKAREATATMPAEFIAPASVDPRGSARVAAADVTSLTCDRGPEWMLFQEIYPQLSHHIVLIAGTPNDAPDYFVVRIEQFLRVQPPFSKATVDWRIRPKTKGEYLERIARALGNAGDLDLPRELRRWMSHKNLILVHPAINHHYEDETLLDYYRQWLPELMDEVRPSMSLKCIQPVVWDSSSRVPVAIRRWLGSGSPQWLLSAPERNGRALIDRMKTIATPSTTAITIELGPIAEKDVRDFCQIARLTPAECEQMLEEMRSKDISAALDRMNHIDDFMRRRRMSA